MLTTVHVYKLCVVIFCLLHFKIITISVTLPIVRMPGALCAAEAACEA